ncbi:MAG: class I SAM-dependent methyltransferase [Chitinophagaceae bacterium]|nr:class I SAM-dependent methyltransferase [Chitinophagaceae bacterium]
MDRKYWEKIAPAYHEEIFDVLHNDKKRIIRSAIGKVASPEKTVIDAGCAIGKWLPVLSPAFKKVIAADISEKNLAIAKKKYPHFLNVEYLRADMSGNRVKLPVVDVVVCINAILTDSLKKRNVFFHNLSLCLKKGGHLILVVPSMESWMLTRIIQHRWNIDMKLFAARLTDKEAAKRYHYIQEGNAEIDNVPTKHYLREELELLLYKEGFLMEDCQKIEYSWLTEFVKPPEWLKKPGPWDWMIMAKKK